ncbi:Ada metal-binding domain-containing protein [Kitasatospora sp. NPDC059648]|uniref:Ada metal-binding domain-containing protein n=1 Tax=Kitasatospora sp. NPDC059648 TaxID=3346894 RepID=UPI0036B034F4
MSPDEIRWEAVTRRDPRSDDAFRYGVLSTRTYSRPSCAARTPSRRNTVFFADARQARNAGFRPCLRCRPDTDTGGIPAAAGAAVRACRLMDRPEQPHGLGTLAALSGFSRFHFHRLFTDTIGVTPKTYAAVCRTARLHHELARADTVTEAIYRSGFNSAGAFYAVAQDLLGMTPTAFRNRGRGVPVRYAVVPDATGRLLVAETPTGLCAVLFGPDHDVLVDQVRHRYAEATDVAADPGLASRLAHALRHGTCPGHPAVPPEIRRRALEGRLRQTLGPRARTP